MADIVYTVNQDSPESIAGFEQYSQEDKALVNSFQINNIFDPTKNYAELHILSLSDELIESDYNYTRYKQSIAAQSAGQDGTSALTIDPIEDSKIYGYTNGGIKLLYHFLDDLYSQDSTKIQFYIQDISTDRTELSLSTLQISSEELTTITSAIKSKLQNQSYFTGFRLNFKENDLVIATNIDTLDSPTGKVVVIKLYEPLPDIYNIKSTLSVVDNISDSVAYEIDTEYILPPQVAPTLRSPNFNIDIADNNIVPTGYYNYNELFSYPINNSNSQIFAAVNKKGIDISINYSHFNNFVHFSSAQERLLNFKYKLDLIVNYSASLSSIASSTTGLQGVSGSRDYYQNLLTGVVSNFDHYERFLYFESGSNCWPKSNNTKPYNNKASNSPETITWYANQIANAISFDNTNYSSLAYSIPTFLRDDANNENYLTFVYMVGQHFDNLWLYSKAVTDKYDADNRIDHGISKDLVGEALRNFGVKLYTSNKSIEDLFTTFIGQTYQSGSEKVNTYITGSLTGSNTPIQPTSYDNYQKEVQKRIYHNLPLLLKSKGTQRGLRALINCLGIPSDILQIKLYGGRNINERPFYGDYRYFTSSLDKIRLDNTGSIVTGSTLSNYVSIIKRDDKYTDDLHPIEVGFSPTDNVDNYIISKSLATASLSNFNIDEYLGDARNLYLDGYYTLTSAGTLSGSLSVLTDQIMSGSTAYNVQDYVRLIKFFDNTIFKMVKDFIPARSTADTGIIIKPHILGRSKAKSTKLQGTRPEYSASIETAFSSGSNGGSFGKNNSYVTAYVDAVQTPLGLGTIYTHNQEEAKYNGELLNSNLTISTVDLNKANIYKFDNPVLQNLYTTVITEFPSNICVLTLNYAPITITSHSTRNIQTDFTNLGINGIVFTSASVDITSQTSAYTFTSKNYTTTQISASNSRLASCSASIDYTTQYCDLQSTTAAPAYIVSGSRTDYDLTTWFTTGSNTATSYTASWGATVQGIANSGSYKFTQPVGNVTITIKDTNISTCTQSKTIEITAQLVTCQLLATVETLAGHQDSTAIYSYTPCSNGAGGTSQIIEFSSSQGSPVTYTINQCIISGSFKKDPNSPIGVGRITYGDGGTCII